MTATDPSRLVDSLDAALDGRAAPARPLLLAALFCAEPHPLDDSTLCRRLSGHGGLHAADGDDTWNDEEAR